VDVRRLAAVDMHGLNGTALRRRLILFEFAFGAVAGIAIGLFLIVASSSPLGVLLGIYAVGVAANYAPLAIHAASLRRPAALRSELRDVDIRAELRHYTRAQLWVFMPLLFVWLDLRQSASRPGADAGPLGKPARPCPTGVCRLGAGC